LTTFEAQTGIRKIGREAAFFIDSANIDSNAIYDKDTYDFEPQTDDIICASKYLQLNRIYLISIQIVAANENWLFIGRLSGTILKYTLPHVSLESKLFVKTRPQSMSLNCNASRIAVIDLNGVLNILEVNSQGG
jgi:hypothetical protein